jgi:hypothetical protein
MRSSVAEESDMQRRVQFAVLLQLARSGTADRATTATVCPGSDEWDLKAALQNLVDEGSIEGPTWRMQSLIELTESGRMTMSAPGQQRLDEDDV